MTEMGFFISNAAYSINIKRSCFVSRTNVFAYSLIHFYILNKLCNTRMRPLACLEKENHLGELESENSNHKTIKLK